MFIIDETRKDLIVTDIFLVCYKNSRFFL